MRKISDSTVRRLSVYLRFLEQAKTPTISSGELARSGGTTVRPGAQRPLLLRLLRQTRPRLLGPRARPAASATSSASNAGYRVVLVGAGRMGGALVQYQGFKQRGFHITAIYDQDARKIGLALEWPRRPRRQAPRGRSRRKIRATSPSSRRRPKIGAARRRSTGAQRRQSDSQLRARPAATCPPMSRSRPSTWRWSWRR